MIRSMIIMEITFTGMIRSMIMLMIRSMIRPEIAFAGMIMVMIRSLLILGRWSCALPPR